MRRMMSLLLMKVAQTLMVDRKQADLGSAGLDWAAQTPVYQTQAAHLLALKAYQRLILNPTYLVVQNQNSGPR